VPAALWELRRCAGAQFDPRMVTALVRALARHGWHPAVTSGDDRMPQPSDTSAPVPGTDGAPEQARAVLRAAAVPREHSRR
jgi:hypothetical protein